jgi:hypothetical protein
MTVHTPTLEVVLVGLGYFGSVTAFLSAFVAFIGVVFKQKVTAITNASVIVLGASFAPASTIAGVQVYYALAGHYPFF